MHGSTFEWLGMNGLAHGICFVCVCVCWVGGVGGGGDWGVGGGGVWVFLYNNSDFFLKE